MKNLHMDENNDLEPPKGFFTLADPNKPHAGLFSVATSSLSQQAASMFHGTAPETRRKRLFDPGDSIGTTSLDPLGNVFEKSSQSTKKSAHEASVRGAPRRPQLSRSRGIASAFGTPASSKLPLKREQSRISQTTPIAARRPRTSSSSSAAEPTAIQCTQVQERFNNKQFLRRHFQRYGDVVRVVPNLDKQCATVRFSSYEDAARAREKGKNFFGTPIHIYFYKPRTHSTDRADKPSASKGDEQYSQVNRNRPPAKIPLKKVSPSSVHGNARKQTQFRGSVFTRTDAEKFALLDKIDKILRSRAVKESDLSKAVIASGTCPDMCPEKERYLREQKNLLSPYELNEDGYSDHRLFVKEYSRSSADQEESLPHELRPSSVLRMTMDYLITHVMKNIDYVKTAEWYDFVWNRTRAIRKELSIQQANDPFAIEVTEECARFHICCAHELCEAELMNFDPKINDENLEKTMKTVLDMYDDVRSRNGGGDYIPPNEAEFRSYFILLNINKTSDVLRALKTMRNEVRYSYEVKLAVAAFSALHSNNYARFFNAVRHASYLQAALLHRYFNQVRIQAVHVLAKACASSKGICYIPAEDVARKLLFNDFRELSSFCLSYDITINEGLVELSRSMDYTAESLALHRSHAVVMKMRDLSLGEIISNNRKPSSDIHKPTSSFSEDGRYIGPHSAALRSVGTPTKTPETKKPAAEQNKPQMEKQQNMELLNVLTRKGITNDMVKNIAKVLFVEVINSLVVELCNEVILSERRDVSSGHVTDVIFEETLREELRRIVANTVLEKKMQFEKEQREAEEKLRLILLEKQRKLEEERRRQERAELIKRSTATLANGLEDTVVSEIIQQIAAGVYREISREEKIRWYSENIHGNMIDSTVEEELREIATAIRKSAVREKHSKLQKQVEKKCAGIRWSKWKQELARLRMYRRSHEMFPCAPLPRSIHQQLDTLLLRGWDVDVKGKRKSLTLDERGRCRLSMDPLREQVQSQLNAVGRVESMLQHVEEAHFKDIPVSDIVFNNFVKPGLMDSSFALKSSQESRIFWKLSIVSDITDDQGTWQTWLQYKLGLRKKDDVDFVRETVTKESYLAKTEDVSSITTQHHLCVCCKMLQHDNVSRSSVFGTSALICMIDNQKVFPSDRGKNLIHKLLKYLPSVPRIPVLVLCCGFSPDKGRLYKELNMGDYVDRVSSFNVISLDNLDFPRNTEKLLAGVEWLASSTNKTPVLTCSSFRDVIEDALSSHYVKPLYRYEALRLQQEFQSLDPCDIVEIYNDMIDQICALLTNPSLSLISWPASEFSDEDIKGGLLFPDEDWNTATRFNEIKSICNQLKLPLFPNLQHCYDVEDVLSQVLKYCQHVCPHHMTLVLSVNSSVTSYIKENEVTDAETFVKFFPWQHLIDVVANTTIENNLFNATGQLLVAFPESSLSYVKIEEKHENLIREMELSELDVQVQRRLEPVFEETLNSQTSGAKHNLERLLLHTANEHESKNASLSWLEDDDVTLEAADDARNLTHDIQNEAIESEKFEKELERLVQSGSEFLEHFTP